MSTETEYVAYGRNEEYSEASSFAYWIASWDDDGPTSEETFADTLTTARLVAEKIARERGLEAVEVDEFGAVVERTIR